MLQPVLLIALAAQLFGMWRGSSTWVFGGMLTVLVLLLARRVGGAWWWGGLCCTRCGYTELTR